VAEKVLDIMTDWPTAHGVPLSADVKIGQSWGQMEKFAIKEAA
jgi:hypothetical protein